MKFPPISWIAPGIIPAEGVTLLCSKPKFGKSWLVYDLCIASAMGRFTLGTIRPSQGDVLYLALEDSKRRLQQRMGKLLPTFNAKWPEKLTITIKWKRLHEGGLDDIRDWHTQTKDNGGKPILVAIDVLAKVRKPSGNKPVYEADYEALTGLCQLAHELGIAIIVVHHTRKMAADDLMEMVSGSFGITGAVDTVLVLASKATGSASGAILDIRGRDIESAELALEFNKNTCRWTILGTAAEIHQSDQRRAIINALTEVGSPMRINALMAATGMKRNPLELLLGKMVKDEAIKRVGIGLYATIDYTEPPKPDKPTKATLSPEHEKSQTDQTDGQISSQAIENLDDFDSTRSVRAEDRPDRPDRSVRSVRPPSGTRQMADRSEATEKTQENDTICPSVQSVRVFTSNPPRSADLHGLTDRQAIDAELYLQGEYRQPAGAYITIRQIHRPAISAGPDDDLDDFINEQRLN
jgi:hypothetical protein